MSENSVSENNGVVRLLVLPKKYYLFIVFNKPILQINIFFFTYAATINHLKELTFQFCLAKGGWLSELT